MSFGFPVASAMCAHVCKHKIFSFRFFISFPFSVEREIFSTFGWCRSMKIIDASISSVFFMFTRLFMCVRACVCVSGTYVKALQCRTLVWHSLFEAKHSLASTHCHSVSFVRACVRAWMAGMAYTHAVTAQCTLCTCNIIIIIIIHIYNIIVLSFHYYSFHTNETVTPVSTSDGLNGTRRIRFRSF